MTTLLTKALNSYLQMIRKFLNFHLLFLLSCQGNRQAEDIPFAYKNIHLGMSMDSVQRFVPGFGDTRIQSNCLDYRGGSKFFDLFFDEVRFCSSTNQRLTSITAQAWPANRIPFDKFRSTLQQKYGTPDEEDDNSARWKTSSSALQINYEEHFGRILGVLVLTDTSLVSKSNM